MQNPDSNSSYNDNPYGAYTQQAQNWENERQRAVAEKNRAWEAAQYKQQQNEEERRRRESNARAASHKTSTKTATPKKTNTSTKTANKEGTALKDIFTVIGFLIGAIGTYQQSEENVVAAIIVGLITGAVGRATYKLIIALGVIAIVLYLASSN